MAEDDLLFAIPQELLNSAGLLINILQALGVFVIIYIIFQMVNTVINRKREQKLEEMNMHLAEIKEILKRQRR